MLEHLNQEAHLSYFVPLLSSLTHHRYLSLGFVNSWKAIFQIWESVLSMLRRKHTESGVGANDSPWRSPPFPPACPRFPSCSSFFPKTSTAHRALLCTWLTTSLTTVCRGQGLGQKRISSCLLSHEVDVGSLLLPGLLPGFRDYKGHMFLTL